MTAAFHCANPYRYSLTDRILVAQDLNFSFGDRKILNNINFEILNIDRPHNTQGQIAVFIGRSGIGKTTLLKLIAGFLKPDSGYVRIGADLHPIKVGEVGYVSQNYFLFRHHTVFDNLRIGLDHSGRKLNKKEKIEIITEYAREFDFEEHLYHYPCELSGGQRQRVCIIQQIITGNKFIMLDEPFSGLDPLMVDKVRLFLKKISKRHSHNTLFIVSHDIINSMSIADVVYIMAKSDENSGATIKEVIDLKKMGLAWKDKIFDNSQFKELVMEMRYKI